MPRSLPWVIADNVQVNTIPATVSSFFSYNQGWKVRGGGFLDNCCVPDPLQHNNVTLFPATTNLTLSGTAALVWGTLDCFNNTPTCGFDVVVDGQSPEKFLVARISNQPLYQSPTLADGTHLIQFTLDEQTDMAVDFALITASNSTDLRATTLFINHTDPAIQYSGNWLTSPDRLTRNTSTVGDELRFSFPGYSVRAFAQVEVLHTGSMTVEVSLDDQKAIPVVIKDPSDPSGGATNHAQWEFYTSPTINVKVTELTGGHVFCLWGFTYLPSFDNLGVMPIVPLYPATKKKKVAGIAAGSAVAAILAVILVMWLVWRRKRRNREISEPTGLDPRAVVPYPRDLSGPSMNQIRPNAETRAQLKRSRPDLPPSGQERAALVGETAVEGSSTTVQGSSISEPVEEHRILSMIDRLHTRLNEIQPPPAYA
ncbi:hypothetical protein C8J56DRAFT_1131632 [Mycena floridula]|nr:hypothetical protein C8J56DRAFT_1131632 [Mycena floridula]